MQRTWLCTVENEVLEMYMSHPITSVCEEVNSVLHTGNTDYFTKSHFPRWKGIFFQFSQTFSQAHILPLRNYRHTKFPSGWNGTTSQSHYLQACAPTGLLRCPSWYPVGVQCAHLKFLLHPLRDILQKTNDPQAVRSTVQFTVHWETAAYCNDHTIYKLSLQHCLLPHR